MTVLFRNIGTLLSFQPLAKEKRGHSITQKDLGILQDAWIFCKSGKVAALGSGAVPFSIQDKVVRTQDMGGRFVMPGLVDSHTHSIFAGDRFSEFSQRLNGATYQEIAAAGGGIQSTMKATREATEEDLIERTLRHIHTFQKKGVTTIEIKTGYGLSVEHELRLARLLKKLEVQADPHIVSTCLALHDHSPEFKNLDDYVAAVTEELLPVLIKEKLVSFVDAFVEKGYFSAKQIEPFILAAKNAGLGIRLHADEFSNAEGAKYAAHWGAASADHLQWANESDAKALAQAKTVATLLPGTSLYTGIPFTDARKFTQAGCAIAIATDFNPGSSYVKSLAELAVIGAIHCHLSSAQALAAVTYVPALSLGLGERKGALSPGFDADFLVYKMRGVEDWLADMGQTLPDEVWIAGN